MIFFNLEKKNGEKIWLDSQNLNNEIRNRTINVDGKNTYLIKREAVYNRRCKLLFNLLKHQHIILTE